MVKLFKVIISPKARGRLNRIYDHYNQTASPSVAKKVKDGLLDTAQSLETFPESRPILPGTEDRKRPYRYAKRWSFKVIFTVFKKKDTVNVIDFFHDKEDPEKLKKL